MESSQLEIGSGPAWGNNLPYPPQGTAARTPRLGGEQQLPLGSPSASFSFWNCRFLILVFIKLAWLQKLSEMLMKTHNSLDFFQTYRIRILRDSLVSTDTLVIFTICTDLAKFIWSQFVAAGSHIRAAHFWRGVEGWSASPSSGDQQLCRSSVLLSFRVRLCEGSTGQGSRPGWEELLLLPP